MNDPVASAKFDSAARFAPLRAAYLADETACVERLLAMGSLEDAASNRVHRAARALVTAVREKPRTGLDVFLHEYDLSSEEGVLLMCLAEALLRVPDSDTADRLIHDKLSQGNWETHLGRGWLLNAATWGLMLTGRLVNLAEAGTGGIDAALKRLTQKGGESLVRTALKAAMQILAGQFVAGRNIAEALEQSRQAPQYRYSFDMLGEAAVTAADADKYFAAYTNAIAELSKSSVPGADVLGAHGISVKLSALHPRYEYAQRERVRAELAPRLGLLVISARGAGIQLTLDAEEADRLELSLELFESVFTDSQLDDWHGFGLAVQAYQKRALPLLDWLSDLASRSRKRIPVRLVKGAYWDSEIKRAQVLGLEGYPVFTRKPATDVSYLACVKRILAAPERFYPQFATHNAHTVAYILEAARAGRDFEFQRLYGMGEALYEEIVGPGKLNAACRVYAPVGGYRELLPYLVRRLLENGANTSFLNRIVDARQPVDKVVAHPFATLAAYDFKPNPRIPLPVALYGPTRRNTPGVNLANGADCAALIRDVQTALARPPQAAPLVGGKALPGEARQVLDPSDSRREVGRVIEAEAAAVDLALDLAVQAAGRWDATPAPQRASILERAAQLMESHRAELIAMLVREGGKTIPDALSEVREAADYCRYYASEACRLFAAPQLLPGPTGERNALSLRGRGVFACISPWNFPLAIFAGQITAALAAGNAVIAKPARQTPLVAYRAIRLLHEAGVPVDALHLLPGPGTTLGMRLVADARIQGVVFTGSTATGQAINRALASRDGAMVPFIAETGGQNAMIVDSSALPEQVVGDVIQSAFNSAGQRCSALRVLFLQEDIADRVITMLNDAMRELVIGDPALLSTDIGPVIDAAARVPLQAHAERMRHAAKLIFEMPLPAGTEHGSFFAPRLFEIAGIDQLEGEVFGPILHVVRYRSSDLDAVIESINRTGFGLTLGIESRIDETAQYIATRVRAGNAYVNRSMIGAVVGVQPFGGEGLSGTGPKAGGPHYLLRLTVERVLSVNTAATGGNATLLAMTDDT